MSIRAFVQARMSSHRFPGKVLAPFRGRPVIKHVLGAIGRALPSVPIVVATSVEESDDPLAIYLESLGVAVFRGPLDDVFERFRLCARVYPCEWILRVNADSPLLDIAVLRAVAEYAGSAEWDLATTICPRTFPRGQNAELIRASVLMAIDAAVLSADDREHVTPVFYRNPNRFRIVNVETGGAGLAETSMAIDTLEDLRRLERLSDSELQRLMSQGLSVRSR